MHFFALFTHFAKNSSKSVFPSFSSSSLTTLMALLWWKKFFQTGDSWSYERARNHKEPDQENKKGPPKLWPQRPEERQWWPWQRGQAHCPGAGWFFRDLLWPQKILLTSNGKQTILYHKDGIVGPSSSGSGATRPSWERKNGKHGLSSWPHMNWPWVGLDAPWKPFFLAGFLSQHMWHHYQAQHEVNF